MNTPKRLLIYVVSFITLNVFAFGFSSLVGWMLDLIGIIGDSQPQNIAPFIAAIIVCFPIWIYFWRLSNRNIQDFPEEEFSSLRNLYLNFVNGLSVIIISISIFGFFNSMNLILIISHNFILTNYILAQFNCMDSWEFYYFI